MVEDALAMVADGHCARQRRVLEMFLAFFFRNKGG
jgi:hypothetical protein